MSGVHCAMLGSGGLSVASLSITAAVSGNNTGFQSGSFGSLSPSSIAGKAVFQLFDTSLGTTVTFAMNGLSADPGKAWLNKITSNSVTLTGAAATYSYSSGTATWIWSSSSFGWTASTFPVSVVHA